MTMIQGFWSYAHADDEYDNGRLAQLAKDVAGEFEMITGEKINLFFDQDNLEWGDKWRRKIDDNIAAGNFFLPILTPRYFMRPECRRELQLYAQKVQNAGLKELILPILYVDVPMLQEKDPTDDLAVLIKSFQWEDWRSVRFATTDSEEYRRAVNKLATRLANANTTIEDTEIPQSAMGGVKSGSEEDEPGTLDRIAEAEASLPAWTETITKIGEEIQSINPLIQTATADISKSDGKGQGTGGRLRVFKRLGNELLEPAARIEQLGQEYTSSLHKVDEGIRLWMDQIPLEIKKDKQAKESALTFLKNIGAIVDTAHESSVSLEKFLESMRPLESMSKDLRKPLRTIRRGLAHVLEGSEIIEEWKYLFDNQESDAEEQQT